MKTIYTIALGLFLLVYGCAIVVAFLASELFGDDNEEPVDGR